jgi:hypothetical protein
MSESGIKPLNWKPEPGIGYTVSRRDDGGMHFVFSDISHRTLVHWREFALQHLYDSDRLTRNLYDLRAIDHIPEEAVRFAVEANSDPSARNIRVAVVVKNETVRSAIRAVDDLTVPGGVELGLFTDMGQAEEWLNRPLTILT